MLNPVKRAATSRTVPRAKRSSARDGGPCSALATTRSLRENPTTHGENLDFRPEPEMFFTRSPVRSSRLSVRSLSLHATSSSSPLSVYSGHPPGLYVSHTFGSLFSNSLARSFHQRRSSSPSFFSLLERLITAAVSPSRSMGRTIEESRSGWVRRSRSSRWACCPSTTTGRLFCATHPATPPPTPTFARRTICSGRPRLALMEKAFL